MATPFSTCTFWPGSPPGARLPSRFMDYHGCPGANVADCSRDQVRQHMRERAALLPKKFLDQNQDLSRNSSGDEDASSCPCAVTEMLRDYDFSKQGSRDMRSPCSLSDVAFFMELWDDEPEASNDDFLLASEPAIISQGMKKDIYSASLIWNEHLPDGPDHGVCTATHSCRSSPWLRLPSPRDLCEDCSSTISTVSCSEDSAHDRLRYFGQVDENK